MFDKHNHIHALTTAIGTMGGMQPQPAWIQAASQYSLWQILMGTILVYQGGGALDWPYSFVVAVIFFLAINLSSYIEIGAAPSAETPAVKPDSEAQGFVGYY